MHACLNYRAHLAHYLVKVVTEIALLQRPDVH